MHQQPKRSRRKRKHFPHPRTKKKLSFRPPTAQRPHRYKFYNRQHSKIHRNRTQTHASLFRSHLNPLSMHQPPKCIRRKLLQK